MSVQIPDLWLLAPVLAWVTSLLLRHRSEGVSIRCEEASLAERVVFLDPLVAGEVMRQPEVLIDEEPESIEPICVPTLPIPEELAPDTKPEECHLS